jgi:hypothetical protein
MSASNRERSRVMAKKSWRDFSVEYPPPKSGFDDGCLELDEVTHVAHTNDAIRVIEDRRIRSSLVYDKSCLNTKRTQVAWVSPKTWTNGYIYGNVAFAFDWASMVAEKKVYWVEHQRTTGQDICRFLICDNKFTDHPLDEYDYTKPHGPLFYCAESDKWYHNNHFTSEYMILSDLKLSDCRGIRFVRHHPRYCNKEEARCPDLNLDGQEAGAEVICRLIGAGQTRSASLFASRSNHKAIDASVDNAISVMYRRIVRKYDEACTGALAESDRPEIMRAIFHASGWHQQERVAALLAQFPDKASVESSFWKCLDEFFDGLKVSRD